ncbi:MAG TPA: hypothetical protein VFD73_00280 [Gemmatimonadales bacterium]|nr:hypothetical protein [Gemmatimonadales bacterium]
MLQAIRFSQGMGVEVGGRAMPDDTAQLESRQYSQTTNLGDTSDILGWAFQTE